MEFQPLKKVGEPVSFKGLRGPYLVDTLIALAITLMFAIVVTMVPMGGYVQLSLCAVAALIFFERVKSNRKKSKGDLNLLLKRKCRKGITIKK